MTFLFSLVGLFAMAQTEHMTFKGVPIDGKLEIFISKLVKQGFTVEYQTDNGAILEGEFAGKSNCSVIVVTTQISKIVWKVAVQFPKKSSWYSLKDEYQTFKTSYTNKYGKPKSYEFFSKPYYEGDGYELQALRNKKCSYISFFATEQGSIVLELNSDEEVQVGYEDGINSEVAQQEKKQIVSDDI